MLFNWLFARSKTPLPKNYKSYIDPEAIRIVDKLQKAGFESYLVGGCVRDIILGKKPKDFDISTSASPQKVKSIISRSFVIGRRFRIVVAKRRQDLMPDASETVLFPTLHQRPTEKEFQITTFRRDPVMVDGKLNENVFGTAAEDASRRDFTLNALFLDPMTGKIIDFLGGLSDLKKKQLRVIGDPHFRFKEDPIRILRALRFVSRANLKLDSVSEAALKTSIPCLREGKKERIREEILKPLREGIADRVLELLKAYDIWETFSPEIAQHFKDNNVYRKTLRIAKSLNENRWTQPSQAPLFYLMLWTFFESGSTEKESFAKILDDLKVFRVERDEMKRIHGFLRRIQKDPTAARSLRLLPKKNLRFYSSLSQGFFSLKVLADAGYAPYKEIWEAWKEPWQSYMEFAKRSTPHSRGRSRSATSARGSETSLRPSGGGGRSSAARPRRRRRRPRIASSATTPSSSSTAGSSSGVSRGTGTAGSSSTTSTTGSASTSSSSTRGSRSSGGSSSS